SPVPVGARRTAPRCFAPDAGWRFPARRARLTPGLRVRCQRTPGLAGPSPNPEAVVAARASPRPPRAWLPARAPYRPRGALPPPREASRPARGCSPRALRRLLPAAARGLRAPAGSSPARTRAPLARLLRRLSRGPPDSWRAPDPPWPARPPMTRPLPGTWRGHRRASRRPALEAPAALPPSPRPLPAARLQAAAKSPALLRAGGAGLPFLRASGLRCGRSLQVVLAGSVPDLRSPAQAHARRGAGWSAGCRREPARRTARPARTLPPAPPSGAGSAGATGRGRLARYPPTRQVAAPAGRALPR